MNRLAWSLGLAAALLALPVGLARPGDPMAAWAQQRPGEDDGPTIGARRNSVLCNFTFYSNRADNLSFQGGDGRRCFDMKGGDDIMILNREEFVDGVDVSTGTGRDQAWLTDGDDLLIDPDGRDSDIRTFEGDDVIELDVRIDKDPFRGVEESDRTEIRPGPGANRIVFGQGIESNAIPRQGFNIWMVTGTRADDTVEAVCGRPTFGRIYDIRTIEVPETSALTTITHGCGVGIFGLYGDLDVAQTGGRLAVRTSRDGFRMPAGENVPRITGEARAGQGLLLDLDRAHPDSSFFYEGVGAASVRNRVKLPGHGGVFRVFAQDEVYYDGHVTLAATEFRLGATSRIDVRLEGRADRTDQKISLSAPDVRIRWIYTGGLAFPGIDTQAREEVVATRFEQELIDFPESDAYAEAVARADVEDPDKVVNPDIPEDVPELEPTTSRLSAQTENVSLSMAFRRTRAWTSPCFSVAVVDADGSLPPRRAACRDPEGALESLSMDAEGYERIEISGEERRVVIPINDDTSFRVHRLDIQV